jgi:hypothetical protein
MVVDEAFLFLTPKGTEELRSRAHKLDFAARNILFLIERGFTTADAIVKRSVFPRDAVSDKLRRLLSGQFVAVVPAAESALPRAPAGAPYGTPEALDFGRAGGDGEGLNLEEGVSLAQARFALSEFCLDHFGVAGQTLVAEIDGCGDLADLKKVLTRIRQEVQSRCREQLPRLHLCVGEINQTTV